MNETIRIRQLVQEVERRTQGQLTPEQTRVKALKLFRIEKRYREEFAWH